MTSKRTTSAGAAPHMMRIAVVAALYAAASLATTLVLGTFAIGPVQLRVSEALCVLALLVPEAVPGLTLGCAIADLATIAFGGTGVLGLLDVVFGSLATFVGASISWRARRRPYLALAGPVIANAAIVPAYLPLMLSGLGFYTIPFTNISFDGAYPLMYAFGFCSIGIGEACVLYGLGLPLLRALKRMPALSAWSNDDETGA